MKSEKIKILAVLLGALLFTFLFWSEKLGLNLFIFTILEIAIILSLQKDVKNSKKLIFTALALFLSSIFMIINHSVISFLSYYITSFVFIGIAFDTEIKTVYTSILAGFMRIISTQFQSLENLFALSKKTKLNNFIKIAKISFIPIITLIIFHLIFFNANPIYKLYSQDILEQIGIFLEKIFSEIFIQQTYTYFVGLVVMNIIIFSGYKKYFNNKESVKQDIIIRKRQKKRHFKLLGLKTENITGIILILLVNVILLINNIIDINWIWFGKVDNNPATLSQLVHQGTYLLILSIFLSMAIMLYFFRQNQNFYTKNKTLKIGAYVWIFQNIILAFSVALRNYHYITNAGLAYKRIGVIFFLLLTIVGLVLMYQKIKSKKTMFYLLKTNSWSILLVLLLISGFNWDVIIAKYNVSHTIKSGIDREFLYKLSDKALYVIEQNNEIIIKNNFIPYKKSYHRSYLNLENNDNWNERINSKKEIFINKMKKQSWKSWNYADYKSYKELLKNNPGLDKIKSN